MLLLDLGLSRIQDASNGSKNAVGSQVCAARAIKKVRRLDCVWWLLHDVMRMAGDGTVAVR